MCGKTQLKVIFFLPDRQAKWWTSWLIKKFCPFQNLKIPQTPLLSCLRARPGAALFSLLRDPSLICISLSKDWMRSGCYFIYDKSSTCIGQTMGEGRPIYPTYEDSMYTLALNYLWLGSWCYQWLLVNTHISKSERSNG